MGAGSVIMIIVLVICCAGIWLIAEADAEGGCLPILVLLAVGLAMCGGLYHTGHLAEALQYL